MLAGNMEDKETLRGDRALSEKDMIEGTFLPSLLYPISHGEVLLQSKEDPFFKLIVNPNYLKMILRGVRYPERMFNTTAFDVVKTEGIDASLVEDLTLTIYHPASILYDGYVVRKTLPML